MTHPPRSNRRLQFRAGAGGLAAALVAVLAGAGSGRGDGPKPSPETLAAFGKVADFVVFYDPDRGRFLRRDTGEVGGLLPAFRLKKPFPSAGLPPCEVPFAVVASGDLTDANLAELARTPNLAVLDLSGCPKLTDAGFAALASAKQLRALSVDRCPLTDAGLAALAESATLAHVTLRKTRVTPAGLGALGASRALRRVSLGGGDLTADALAATPLDILDLSLPNPTDAAVRAIRSTARELRVRFGYAQLGDAAVCEFLDRHAATLTEFEALDSLDVTDGVAERLGKCTKLRVLAIRRTNTERKPLTDRTLARLAGLAELTDLTLAGADLSPAAAATLKGFTKLRALDLAATELLPQDLEPLVGAVDLRSLDFSNRRYDFDKIKRNGVSVSKAVRERENFREQFLRNDAFYSVGTLAKFAGLRWLNLHRNKLTAANLAELYPLAELRSLNLSENPIVRVPVPEAPAFPQLVELDLTGTSRLLYEKLDPASDSVMPVARFGALKVLRISFHDDEKLRELRKKLPNCEVLPY